MNSKWCEDVWDGQTIFIGKKEASKSHQLCH